MKQWMGILTAILILAVQAGCTRTPVRQTGSATAPQPESSKAESSAVSSEAGLKPGEAVQAAGEDSNFQLHGIDFLDDGIGWMIQDRYDSGTDSYRSQLLATADGGENWSKAGTDGRQLDTVRFADKTEGWAVSEETVRKQTASQQGQVKYAVLHTTDGGTVWSTQWTSGVVQKNNSMEAPEPVLWFGGAQSGYALVPGSLLKSTGDGKTWTSVSFGIKDFSPVKLFFTDQKTGWAAGISEKGAVLTVLHTSDGGKSWSRQFQKRMEDQNAAGCAGMDFLNAKEGWFLTSDLATMEGELYHTADGGLNWEKAGQIKCNRPTAEGLDFTDSKTGWVPLSAGAGPIDGGLSVTRDGGKTFQIVGENDTNGDGETRKITSAREIVFRNKTLGWAVGEDLAGGNVDDLLKTTDGGNTWEQIYPKPEPTAYFSFLNGTTGYGLGKRSDAGALLKTVNGGQSWQTLHSFTGQYQTYGVSFLNETEGLVLAMPESANTPNLVVLRTADGGKTWSVKSQTDLKVPSDMVSYFGFSDQRTGFLVKGIEISRTADGGETWKPVNSGQDAFVRELELRGLLGDAEKWQSPAGGAYSFCAASLLPGGTGFVLAGQGGQDEQNEQMVLLTTSDAGKTWSPHPLPEELNGETFDPADHPCLMQFTDASHGWILAADGLLSTADGGRSWAWN